MGLRGKIAAAILLVSGVLVASSGVVSAFDDTVPWYQRPVTVGTGFVLGNGPTVGRPVVSMSGQWVAFASAATNLVAGDNNGKVDLFLRDRFHDVTTRIVEDVETAIAMSPNGRFVVFTAPGDPVSNGPGTTRDGILDLRSGNVTAVPRVWAINSDGWFAQGAFRAAASESSSSSVGDAPSMSRLNDDGSVGGPFAAHRPRRLTAQPERTAYALDASLQYGVYASSLTSDSPYRIQASDASVPVLANMVSGTERSVIDTQPDPATHPTSDRPPTISQNGRYIAFETTIRGVTTQKLWDTTTGRFFSGSDAGRDGWVSDDGRIVSPGNGSMTLGDVRVTCATQPAVTCAGFLKYLSPFDATSQVGPVIPYGFASDSNRVLACTTVPYSRFDTNGTRDCYLVPLPPVA